MDILAYEILFDKAKEFNEKCGKPYGNEVVHYPTKNTTFPHTVIDEIRNVANPSYNTCHERVASVGYMVKIFAKTKGNITKQTIARTVAQMIDTFMSSYQLTRISYNANESVNDDSIYEIIMTYSGNLHENRRRFI